MPSVMLVNTPHPWQRVRRVNNFAVAMLVNTLLPCHLVRRVNNFAVAMLANMPHPCQRVRRVNNFAAAMLVNTLLPYHIDRREPELVVASFPMVHVLVFYAVWVFRMWLDIFFFVVALPTLRFVAAFAMALAVSVSVRLRIYLTRQKYLHQRTILHPPRVRASAFYVHNPVL